MMKLEHCRWLRVDDPADWGAPRAMIRVATSLHQYGPMRFIAGFVLLALTSSVLANEQRSPKPRLREGGVAVMLVGTAATIAGLVLLGNDISAWGAGLGERPNDAQSWPHAYEGACALLPLGQASVLAGIVMVSASF